MFERNTSDTTFDVIFNIACIFLKMCIHLSTRRINADICLVIIQEKYQVQRIMEQAKPISIEKLAHLITHSHGSNPDDLRLDFFPTTLAAVFTRSANILPRRCKYFTCGWCTMKFSSVPLLPRQLILPWCALTMSIPPPFLPSTHPLPLHVYSHHPPSNIIILSAQMPIPSHPPFLKFLWDFPTFIVTLII